MTRLDKLLDYQQKTRRAGHTTLMAEGIHFNRRGLILFASLNHARIAFKEALDRADDIEELRPNFAQMRIGQVQFQSIGILDKLEELMRGFDPDNMPPVIVDHFAMSILVDEHTAENIWEGFNYSQEGDNGEYWSDCHPGGKKLTEDEKKVLVFREVHDRKRFNKE